MTVGILLFVIGLILFLFGKYGASALVFLASVPFFFSNVFRKEPEIKQSDWREERERLQRERKEREEKRHREAMEKLKKANDEFKVVDDMTGYEFERYCAALLRKHDFENVRVTQASGDHGVDVLAEKDGHKYAVQCKRYAKPVGFSAVKEVFTGMALYETDKGMIMTTSTFTDQAKQDANKLGVELWDRHKVMEMAK